MREHLVDNHSDGAYAVLRFTATCPAALKVLDVDYRLLFDVDPQHRGLLNLAAGDERRAGILSIDAPGQQFVLAALSPVQQFVDYLEEGVFHIWTGFDHLLFLLSLLLPAVLVRTPGPAPSWTPAASFGAAFRDALKVVTAFTVAHSITLSLAALGVISLPSRLVESAIAVSVILAALNNVRPVVHGGRWIVAFCFGLIHGFGFASVLADLGLPQSSLLQALIAFNLGVELGQLVIVAAFLPIAYASRQRRFSRSDSRRRLCRRCCDRDGVAARACAERGVDFRTRSVMTRIAVICCCPPLHAFMPAHSLILTSPCACSSAFRRAPASIFRYGSCA